jgi:1,2-diacylglycerol 3-beta-galactosyltransferase
VSKVLILTSDAGFGHRRAAEAIAAALDEVCASRCEVEIRNPLHDPDIPDLVKMLELSYDEVVIDDPTLYQLAYSATDAPVVAQLMQKVTTTVLNKTLTKWVSSSRPDLLMTTYPAYTQAAVRAVRDAGYNAPVTVTVTDLIGVHTLWFHQEASLTFVPTGSVYKQALDHGLDKDRVHLTGLPVMPKFAGETRDRAALRAHLGWNPDMTTALIVGSARTRQTAAIARLLDRSGLPLQVVVVSGGDEEITASLETTEWQGTAHIYGLVGNMPEFLKAADFIICKAGGLIVSEALACGLPLILYEALPGQEVGNVRYVVDAGAGVWSPGPIGALTTVYAWMAGDGAELARRRAAAERIGKPRAAYDIAGRVMRLLGGG